jgi:hypothetical protein
MALRRSYQPALYAHPLARLVAPKQAFQLKVGLNAMQDCRFKFNRLNNSAYEGLLVKGLVTMARAASVERLKSVSRFANPSG